MSYKARVWYRCHGLLVLLFITASGAAWAAPPPIYVTANAWELWVAAHVVTILVGAVISVYFADTPTDMEKPIPGYMAFIAGIFVGFVALGAHSSLLELSGLTLVSVACISSAGCSLVVTMRKMGMKFFPKLGGDR